MKLNLLFVALFVLASCNGNAKDKNEQNATIDSLTTKPQQKEASNYKTAYFAGGCFWCEEAIYESVKGIKEVESGYAGGMTSNPTYEEVSTGKTGHAETVKIYYDPKVTSFKDLVIAFFSSHDPTTLNQQGPDRGSQYRSIAFYQTQEEKQTIENVINYLNSQNIFGKKVVTEVKQLKRFWPAEDYHQDYEKKHPDNPYIQSVSKPRLESFKKRLPQYIKPNEKEND
ncbi:peptide-methionine (S)-S-oxide reductase MsrA [Zhouia sp. PK063]|uniref:peptide-methionine (S)-S-oxide reductase MsrA n=1 Tax=Zhouia sp. PK063 TaxID=3373602 RepID=UPI0037A53E0D